LLGTSKYIQSRMQGILNLLYVFHCKMLIASLAFLISIAFSNPEYIYLYVITWLCIPVIVILWLSVFNTGASKVIERGLIINSESVTYINFDEQNTIKWSEFDGFEVSKKLMKQITIRSKKHADIVFGFYEFSPRQKESFLNTLNNKKNTMKKVSNGA